MTLQEIDEMAITEPYCFENEQEEQWYKVGLREGADAAIKQLGWHPASELPNMGEEVVTWVNHGDGVITVSRGIYVGWPEEIINKLRWCYPPK